MLKKKDSEKKAPASKPKKQGGLFSKKKSKKPTVSQEPGNVTGSGTVVMESASRGGVIIAWLLVGFVTLGVVVALVSTFLTADAEQPEVQAESDPQTQQVGAYAQEYVGAWLRSSRNDSEDIQAFGQDEVSADEETAYRDLGVASVEDHGDNTYTAVIAGSIQHDLSGAAEEDEDADQDTEPADSSSDEGSEDQELIWQRSWYQVNIAADEEGNFSPVGWPTPVTAPSAGEAPVTAYEEEVLDEGLTSQVSGFLNAYTAHTEDEDNPLSLYVHPSADIEPISPAPFDSVEVTEISAATQLPENTSTGDELQVAAEVGMTTAEGTRPGTYYLSLEVRDGRWEITEIDTSPQMAVPEDEEATPTPEESASEPEVETPETDEE